MAAKFPLEVVISAVDKATAPLARIQKRLSDFGEPVRRLRASFAGLMDASGLSRFGKSVGNVREKLGAVVSEAGALIAKVTAVAGVAGFAMFRLVKGTADYGDNVDELAKKAMMSAQAFQRQAYAAKFSGIEQEQLAGAYGKLGQNIVEAIGGNKKLAAAFAFAGINAKQLRTMKPEQIIGRIADRIKELPQDDPRRGALARALFGKSGADLIPMLENGAARIKELGDEAQRMGIILSDEQVAQAAEFNDQFDRTSMVVGGVVRSIGAQLLPVIQPLLAQLANFIMLNRELIQQKVSEWVGRFSAYLKTIDWKATFDGISNFISGTVSLIDKLGGLQNILIAVGVFMGASFIASVASAVTALWGLGAAAVGVVVPALSSMLAGFTALAAGLGMTAGVFAALLGWIGLIVAAVVAVGYGLYKLWENWDEVWSWIKESTSDVVRWVADKVSALASLVPDWVKRMFGAGGSVSVTANGAPAAAGATATTVAREAAAAGAPGANGKTQIDVNFKNAPAGTTATPTKEQGSKVNTRMGWSMMEGVY